MTYTTGQRLGRPTVTCPCQWGPSSYCLNGRHAQCRNGTPTTYPETWITDADGRVWGLAHQQVQVWLADRICRWICRCDCHAPAKPEPVQGVLPLEVA